GCATRRATHGRHGGPTGEHLLRGPHGHGRLPRGGDGAHHRGRRPVPRLYDARVRDRVPRRPVRTDVGRRDPLQLRAVLRVRDVLPRVQHRGGHHVALPGGRLRRGVPAGMTVVACLKWVDHKPDVDPLTGAVRTDWRTAGLSDADRAALEWALRLGGEWGEPVVAVSAGPAAADAVLVDALSAGATRAVRVELPLSAPSDTV